MKRILSVFLLSFFALNITDIPFELIQAHSAMKQCCCKSGICRCRHTGKNDCPMQRKSLTTHTDAQSKTTGFSPWDCGSGNEKSTSPTYSKEFYLKGPSTPFQYETPQFLFNLLYQNASRLIDQRIDQPPRVF